MKKLPHKTFLGALFSTVLLAADGFGQTTTNFSSGYFNTNNGYEVGYEIDGQPNYPSGGWASTDPYNEGPPATGARSVVQFFNFYTLGIPQDGNNSVLFGGYANSVRTPGVTNPSLYYSFTPTAAAASDVVNFSIDFALYRPSPEFTTNRDTFGFTLWDSFDANKLLEFQFDPRALWLTNDSTYGFSWLQDGASQTNNPALTSDTWTFNASSIYRLDVTISEGLFDAQASALSIETNGVGAVTNYVVADTVQLIGGGEIGGGLDVQDFGSFSLDWQLESGEPSDPGERYMVVNQISVTTVPEPRAILLLFLGACAILGQALRRRRLFSSSSNGPDHVAKM